MPAVLVVVVGNPLTGGLGHAWRPLPRDALCLLVLAAWVAWAACCAQLLRAVVMHVRRGEVGPRQDSSVLDRLAARIAFGVLALTSFGTPLSLAAGAGASSPAIGGPRPSITAPLVVGAVRRRRRRRTRRRRLTTTRTYTVRPGDTLWGIADDLLGDGADWTSLAALNLGRDVGGGMRFVDPDQLREGWRLRLPADDPPSRTGTHARTSHASPHPEQSAHLPELLALGLGSVACAALARRARRRRRPGDRYLGDPIRQPSEGALDAATLLERFAEYPGPPFVRSRQLHAGPGSGGSSLPAAGSSNLCLALRCHLLVRPSRTG